MKINWTKQAAKNLDTIGRYIARENPDASGRVIAQILQMVNRLSIFPLLGKQSRLPRARESIVPNLPYIIFYRIRTNRIDILWIIHSARQWPPFEKKSKKLAKKPN